MSDQRDVEEPVEEHVREASQEELASEDAVEQTLSEDAGRSPIDAHPDTSGDTADPGRQNPIVPGEGRIEEPT